MALVELKFGNSQDKEFDPAEAEDLKLHVRACQRRFLSLDRKLNMVLYIGVIIIILYVLSEPGSVVKLIQNFF